MKLGFLDTETSSDIDIKGAGTIRYAEACSPLSVHVVLPGAHQVRRYEAHLGPVPDWLDAALLDAETIWVAHNAMFDRTVVVEGLGYYNLQEPDRWICTAALCRYLGVPASLDGAAIRLELKEQKSDYGGTAGINLFTKRYSPKFRTPAQEPEAWKRFMGYGDQDTRILPQLYAELKRRIPMPAQLHWANREKHVFHWDQRINQLGIPVDPKVLDSALAMIAKVHPQLEREMGERTDGEVKKVSSPKLLDYLNSEFLLRLPNLQKATLVDALEVGDLPIAAEELVRLRLHGAKNSLAKYGRMDQMMSSDQRVRAGFLYHGAHTGRWAGQGFQPQNLSRPTLDHLDPVEVADAVAKHRGNPDALVEQFDAPIYEILVSGLRGAIVAGPGKVLVIGDYNQIESRMLAEGAGCTAKQKAFADHDAGRSKLDPYEVTARDVLGDASRRFEGKTMDLGLGFGMGDVKFAKVANLPYLRARDMVADWRSWYSEVPKFWYEMNDAFIRAILSGASNKHPVTRDRGSKLGVMTLPSGKPLFYHGLRLATWGECLVQGAKYGRLPEARKRMERAHLDPGNPEHLKQSAKQVAYVGSYGNRRLVHGGFLVENWDQGTSREVMVEHALEIEQETGDIPVLHSHDELVFEIIESEANAFAQYLTEKMSTSPSFLPTLPLKAEVKISKRYTK